MALNTTYAYSTIRSEFLVNSNATGNTKSFSNVIELAGGGFAVTYNVENGANDVPYVNIYNTVTGAVSPLFLPYDVSVSNMIGEPVIAQLTTNGHVVVVWKEGSGGSNFIVRTTFDPATGTAIGPREVVASNFPGDTDPEITALSSADGGGYVCVRVGLQQCSRRSICRFL